ATRCGATPELARLMQLFFRAPPEAPFPVATKLTEHGAQAESRPSRRRARRGSLDADEHRATPTPDGEGSLRALPRHVRRIRKKKAKRQLNRFRDSDARPDSDPSDAFSRRPPDDLQRLLVEPPPIVRKRDPKRLGHLAGTARQPSRLATGRRLRP